MHVEKTFAVEGKFAEHIGKFKAGNIEIDIYKAVYEGTYDMEETYYFCLGTKVKGKLNVESQGGMEGSSSLESMFEVIGE